VGTLSHKGISGERRVDSALRRSTGPERVGAQRHGQHREPGPGRVPGADAVLDYTKEHAPRGGKLYDLVLDAVGTRKTSRLKVACRAALLPGGRYLSVDRGMPRPAASDLALLTELAEAGRLKPVIDRRYR
jgi:NADPH:quinone reductase-like Zn-dependent oxidoreductase